MENPKDAFQKINLLHTKQTADNWSTSGGFVVTLLAESRPAFFCGSLPLQRDMGNTKVY